MQLENIILQKSLPLYDRYEVRDDEATSDPRILLPPIAEECKTYPENGGR